MNSNVIIVGAGIAGLACARRLQDRGVQSVVLEKSRGVGGRCATRRVRGQAVDHGVPFYHGSDPEFLASLTQAGPSALLDGWPRTLHGSGRPCQARSILPGETRLAFYDGMTIFPKALAEGLDIRFETRVDSVRFAGGQVRVRTEAKEEFVGPHLALTLPSPQTEALLKNVENEFPELRSFARLLEMTDTVSCLTVLAGYDANTPMPEWDLCHPDDSDILQMCSHDSTKRRRPEFGVLVLHAFPGWSKQNFEKTPEVWQNEMLAEAARLLGSWASRPVWTESHRWRYGRADGGPGMKQPFFSGGNGRAGFGVAGEMFAPGGGVQAAWLSGRRLADRILGEEL